MFPASPAVEFQLDDAAHRRALPDDAWATLDAGTLTVFATGNLDEDPALDVWWVSSVDQPCRRQFVTAGTPCHLVDDASE